MTSKETRPREGRNKSADSGDIRYLLLHNDDHNTFEFVIQTLMEVCDHNYVQASQCAVITHYKGKCEIKKGKFAGLKAMRDALTEKNLTATID